MSWPLVHRARYEAEVMLRASFAARVGSLERSNLKLVDELIGMKRDGFSTLPAKIAPQASDPETKYVAAQEAEAPADPFLAGLVAEGYTSEQAHAIRREAIDAFRAGEA